MTAKETVRQYFDALEHKNNWDSLLADDMSFTSLTSPNRQLSGRDAFLESTRRFYSMIRSVDVRTLIADGDRVSALTRYELQPPSGPAFTSDVAEMFVVKNDRIAQFDIVFDSAPYPKPPTTA